MMLVLDDSSKRTLELAKKINELKAKNNPISDELLLDFKHSLSLTGELSKAVKNRQTNIARSLGIFSQYRNVDVNRQTAFDEILQDPEGLKRIADQYITVNNNSIENAHKLAEKSLVTKVSDLVYSVYVNGLLSSFGTHFRNITKFLVKKLMIMQKNFKKILFLSNQF